MSIMRDMMESLDKLSVAQIQQGLQQGRYPAYLAIPAIELKTRMQKQFEQQQAMQQQPPQSTIAEQIMQEAQGVDQLPSNLPQEYAAGGIVAFGDGGEVERYQMGGAVAFSRGGHLRAKAMFDDLMREEQFQAQLDRIKAARDAAKASAEAAKTAGPAAAVAGEAATTAQAATEAAKAASGPSRFQAIRQALQPSRFNPNIPMPSGTGAGIPGVLKGSARLAGKLAGPLAAADLATSAYDLYNVPTDVAREYYGMQLKPGEEPSFMGDVGVRARTALGLLNPFGSAQEGITALMAKRQEAEKAAFKMPTDITRPDVMTGVYPSSGAGPGAGAAPAGPSIFGATAAPQFAPFGREEQATRQDMAALEEQERARRAGYEQQRAGVEGKVTGKALEGYEKEIRDAAMEAGASKKQAQAMALVEAGFAMMGGNSQNALENIGRGALVGVNSYKSALKDIEKAQKEHRQALAGIEQARRAETIGNRDRELKYLEKAYDAETESGRAMVNAIMKARGVDETRAIEIWKTQFGGAKTIEGIRIQAAATLGAAQARQKESGISPYQQQMLLSRARQEYPLDMAREELAQRKGMKVPPVGKNTAFDDEARRLHNARLAEIAGIPMPGVQQAAGPRAFPGFETLSVRNQ